MTIVDKLSIDTIIVVCIVLLSIIGVYPKFCVNRPKMQNEAVEFELGGDLPPGFVYYIRYRTPITAGRYRPTGIGVLLHKTDNRNRI